MMDQYRSAGTGIAVVVIGCVMAGQAWGLGCPMIVDTRDGSQKSKWEDKVEKLGVAETNHRNYLEELKRGLDKIGTTEDRRSRAYRSGGWNEDLGRVEIETSAQQRRVGMAAEGLNPAVQKAWGKKAPSGVEDWAAPPPGAAVAATEGMARPDADSDRGEGRKRLEEAADKVSEVVGRTGLEGDGRYGQGRDWTENAKKRYGELEGYEEAVKERFGDIGRTRELVSGSGRDEERVNGRVTLPLGTRERWQWEAGSERRPEDETAGCEVEVIGQVDRMYRNASRRGPGPEHPGTPRSQAEREKWVKANRGSAAHLGKGQRGQGLVEGIVTERWMARGDDQADLRLGVDAIRYGWITRQPVESWVKAMLTGQAALEREGRATAIWEQARQCTDVNCQGRWALEAAVLGLETETHAAAVELERLKVWITVGLYVSPTADLRSE